MLLCLGFSFQFSGDCTRTMRVAHMKRRAGGAREAGLMHGAEVMNPPSVAESILTVAPDLNTRLIQHPSLPRYSHVISHASVLDPRPPQGRDNLAGPF